MLNNKKLLISIFLINLVALLLGMIMWYSLCKKDYCSYEFRNAYFDPVMSGLAVFLLSLIPFLFASSIVLKNWLKYIASWYVPMSIFFVSQISIYSSSVMSIDRVTAAVYWMLGLFAITLVFILVQRYYFKVK